MNLKSSILFFNSTWYRYILSYALSFENFIFWKSIGKESLRTEILLFGQIMSVIHKSGLNQALGKALCLYDIVSTLDVNFSNEKFCGKLTLTSL